MPTLVNSPELLSLAIAAWVGLCLYVSLLDRTPRSYMFMLAGYTCALLRPLLERAGVYRFVWHRALFDLALYVCLLGGVVYLSSGLLS